MTEAKAKNIQKEANQSIKAIEKRHQEALNRYRGRFYLTAFYATLTTLLRAFCSEILIRDAVDFFEGFAGVLGSVTSGFLSFADAVAGLGDELSQPAVGSIVHRLLWLLVLAALAGGCLTLIGYAAWKYICFFKEKQADELSAFIGLAILAVVVFTGDMLAEILPINMILLGIICFIGYSLIRAVLEIEDKELRNRMLVYTGIALGSIGCVALVLRIAGPMVLFVVPAALLFAAAGN